MTKYLVVAHQTATHPRLLDKLRELHQNDPEAEFTLLVPATLIHHLIFWKGGHEEATTVASQLADKAKEVYAEESLPVTETRVGSDNPLEAIDTELSEHPDYAGIVISTLSQEHSRWLLMDITKHVEDRYTGLPVYHVIGPVDLESDAY
jgi:hypothetical protein